MTAMLSQRLPSVAFAALVAIAAIAAITASATAHADDAPPPCALDEAAVQSTRAMATELLNQLGQTLKSTLSAQGPEAAVSVCKEASPSIATSLSRKHGAQMTRVGTRVRNPAMGTPNRWQQEALAQFETRLAKGDAPAALEYWKVADDGKGQRELHYAKAIMVQPMCVTCHGNAADIPASLAEKIRIEYPQDQATGYSVGKLRGAVVVTRPLP